MQAKNSWLLPEGIEELLPTQAKQLERLRRRLLDLFSYWGYELVIPPLIDYLDSLLTGSGHDLDLQTFKLTDQLTGELLGIRADITPQVARIDAHNLKSQSPTRLCYAGTVLHTCGDPLDKTRSPMQIGAELYGHASLESDNEVICLMLEMLAITGLQNIHLDLGHVGIYRNLSKQAGLTESQENELFEILQRKSIPDLTVFLAELAIDYNLKELFSKLPKLNGNKEILGLAKHTFSKANDEVRKALSDLEEIANRLALRFPNLTMGFDLAELRGFNYHTGIIFAAFIPEVGKEIARGGRYDNIGAVFGRARPATGFSADLKLLSTLSNKCYESEQMTRIFAPYLEDTELSEKIRDLRASKITVIQQLPNQTGGAIELNCTAVLEKINSQWVVKPLTGLE